MNVKLKELRKQVDGICVVVELPNGKKESTVLRPSELDEDRIQSFVREMQEKYDDLSVGVEATWTNLKKLEGKSWDKLQRN